MASAWDDELMMRDMNMTGRGFPYLPYVAAK